MIDPTRWAVLGKAIASDRMRQGLTQKDVAARVQARGISLTERTVINIERGDPHSRKPVKLEAVVAALGWQFGWADRILAGEDPGAVVRREEPAGEARADTARTQLRGLVPPVYEFSRAAVRLGAPTALRDAFERLTEELLDSVTGVQQGAMFELAADRPHAEGEGVPPDDVARIGRALSENG